MNTNRHASTDAVIQINSLSISYGSGATRVDALVDCRFELLAGRRLGIMGQSGSGKTTLVQALFGMFGKGAQVSGDVRIVGREMLHANEKQRDELRWTCIALAFQNRVDVFDPLRSVRDHLRDVLVRHRWGDRVAVTQRCNEVLSEVGLELREGDLYPHELSGGMRQRAILAMALVCRPDILLLDEPSSELDTAATENMIALIERICAQTGPTLITISHDWRLLQRLSDRLLVLDHGCVIEDGPTLEVLTSPQHPGTRGLLNSSPSYRPHRDLWGMPYLREQGTGCVFYDRCPQAISECMTVRPRLERSADQRKVACIRGGIVRVLEASGISKRYRRKDSEVQVLENCSIEVFGAEVVALIGPSGSGKTTLARILAGLLEKDAGSVLFQGRPIRTWQPTQVLGGIQYIDQDPHSALNKRFSVLEAVREPLLIGRHCGKEEAEERATEALEAAGLRASSGIHDARVVRLSGGEAQRVVIARALVMKPALIIADEITSKLDASVQANVLRYMKGLQHTHGFSMVFVSHDISIVEKVADRVIHLEDISGKSDAAAQSA